LARWRPLPHAAAWDWESRKIPDIVARMSIAAPERKMTISRRSLVWVSALVCGGIAAASVSRRSFGQPLGQSAAESFFRGKSIRLLVGTTPGAGYDLVARLLAAHMGGHIPGNPAFVVENMAGAGSLAMMNHLYNRAPRDGTVMGVPLNGVVLEPTLKLLSRNGGSANFDIDKMSWIGSTTQDAQVLWFRSDSGINNIDDLRTTKSIVGASAPGADNLTVTVLTNRLLGAKMELVRGYQGTNDIFLAVERGEAQGSATAYSAIVSGRPQWLKEGKIRLLIQYGAERLPELPDVPTAIEVTRDDEIRQMLRFFGVKFKATYPFVLPQDVPAERVAALQAGFDATMRDPAFAADMEKSNIPLRPVSGPEVQRLIRETYATPEKMLERLREAVTP
jgi:tripartite-type tricarboxylate transporter receptor subunit TctC